MIVSTYRLQLNRDFGFRGVEEYLDYFSKLGVTHLYLSPVLKARPGSPHCYDVVDQSTVNDELGGEAGYRQLIRQARQRGLGIIQDIVPNHMAVHSANTRLMDVLEHGMQSRYAGFFDIDWEASARVVLPLLEEEPRKLAAKGLLRVTMVDGKPVINYREMVFPVNRAGIEVLSQHGLLVGGTLGEVDVEVLMEVLAKQEYILAESRAQPNYRRFFHVNELIGVNVEKRWVFDDTHCMVKRFVDLGVEGLRVDHVDGLMFPSGYLEWLRALVGNAYIVVEKILSGGEQLRRWQCEGTTGYDFLNAVNQLFVDHEKEKVFSEIYEHFIGGRVDVDALIVNRKRRVVDQLLKSEFDRVFRQFSSKIADFDGIKQRLMDFIVRLPVYRTYVSGEEVDDLDAEIINGLDSSGMVFSLLGKAREPFLKLQQILPAVMAKGVEDSVLFAYNRLLSLNEVGCDPRVFGTDVGSFHDFNRRRLSSWPMSMSTTSTHDSKLSEDARCRLNVLSQVPKEWSTLVDRLHDTLRPKTMKPNDEYRLYQALVASWPSDGIGDDYKQRIRSYTIKAMREAAENTEWVNPDLEYERKVMAELDDALNNRLFIHEVDAFVRRISPMAMLCSLSTLVLKMTSPGVADTYQGCEVWRHLLTDPDNRRPVDFKVLSTMLDKLLNRDGGVRGINWANGEIKMYVTTKLLRLRANMAQVFIHGDYDPLRLPSGFVGYSRAKHVVIIVPRLFTSVLEPAPTGSWINTMVQFDAGRYMDIITHRTIEISGSIALGDLLADIPIAVLIKQ
jgi:(1->4)-alpha-D-glucan 1-alpha-D-glucosylmutase